MNDNVKVADEKVALLEKDQKHNTENQNQPNQNEDDAGKKSAPRQEESLNYLLDYLNNSKYQFLFFFDNIIFFFLFRSNINNEDNFPQGMEFCFSLRVWSTLVMAAYFVGIFIRLGYLVLMAIIIYYKKEISKIGPNANKHEYKAVVDGKVRWNLRYKYFVERRDLFLGSIIVVGIFLLVGMTIATTQSEPCGNLRGLSLFWIYIYNIVFLFFPITMLIMCLYPYNIACKIFSGFLKFYSLQLDIFEAPPKTSNGNGNKTE